MTYIPGVMKPFMSPRLTVRLGGTTALPGQVLQLWL